ncbi:MAG: FAD-dependent thymidylate synthase [Verrucomicrobiota bacterium]|nr:MAG: FAD-dependent thymidylate synthase [Verrucomicrobiota bacterium]
MKIIPAHVELLTPIDTDAVMRHIEQCGRVCYKSEGKTSETSAATFIAGIVKRGHEAVLEHYSLTLKFICDRGVSHEIVRHRIASYCQESTRYCNYAKDQFGHEITVIAPCFWVPESACYREWVLAMEQAETRYFKLLEGGATPQEARAVLPNSLKTEVVMSADLREWRHFFRLRCTRFAHPQIREVALQAFTLLAMKLPIFFQDLAQEFKEA